MGKKKAQRKRRSYASAGGASPDELNERVGKLRERFKAAKIDAMLVTSPVNVRYLSGFTGDDSHLLVTARALKLLSDFRYVEEAALTAPHARVIDRKKKGLMELAARHAAQANAKVLGCETTASLGAHKTLRKHCQTGSARGRIRLKATSGLVERLRIIKSPREVRQIELALRAQQAAFRRTVEALKTGASELAVAARLRYEMTRNGAAQDQAFDTIVAFDARASLPHARPGTARLKKNALVLIDWGAKANFYHADLTRTFFRGRIPPKLREIWEIAHDAQCAALESIGPGVKLAEIDKAAREIIRRAGYGKAFGHGLGHGLGLEIHEAPRVAASSKDVCRPGMVFTIEPGIYLPGLGGVRIEDDVLVTESGCRVLSSLPKRLEG
jgi:Xaa-Pro aminopeptidase